MKTTSLIPIIGAILGLLITSISVYASFTGKEIADSNMKTGLILIAGFGTVIVGCSVYLYRKFP